MKSSVEKLSDTRVKLTVEVPFDELGPELDAAYKAIAQQVNIPGFRKGKAPRQLIDARFGRGPVMEQVINEMLPSRYGKAVEDNELAVMGQPDIDITKLEDGKLVEFTAEVDVRPEITLPAFEDFAVDVEAIKSDDEAVDAELETLRKRFATRVVADRAAAADDIVTLNIKAVIDGEEVEELGADDLTHIVGTDGMIDGLDEAVNGLAAGESKDFTTTAPVGEYEGKEATLTVTVTKVQSEELPELDDDFAQLASEFDTLDELREDTVKKVAEQSKATQAAEIRDAVLKQALEACTFELPQGVVTEQIEGQNQQLLGQLGGDDSLLDSILAGQNMTRADFEARTREQAESAVRTQLFLDALADEIKPEVTQEELSDHIMFTARSYGMDPNQFLAQLSNSGQIANLFADVRRGKALAAAICKVKVTDSEGNNVDPAEYFGEEEIDTDTDTDAETAADEN